MNMDIYNKINAEYSQKRYKADLLRELREKEVFESIPEIVEINDSIEMISFETMRTIVFAKSNEEKENASNKLKEAIDELSDKKDVLMQNAGYPLNYLDDVYECTKCKDRGTVVHDGRLVACACFKQRLIEIAHANSGIGTSETYSFDHFDLSLFDDSVDETRYGIKVSPRENILSIKEQVINYCDEKFAVNGEKNLLFSGQIGCGKTFLSKCIGKYLIDKGYSVLYISAPEMFDIINSSKIKNDLRDELVLDKTSLFKETDCLIIDDLGTETISEAKLSALLSLLNYRIEMDKDDDKPYKIIISTNIPAEKIAKMYDDSIASRIWGNFYMYRFAGNDLRLS